MREIKFRGKRISNSEWVYGYYFESFTGTSYILGMYDHLLEMAEHYEVDTKTVGQFTGLLDKNGKEIYDGDIIDDHFVGIGVVKYVRGAYRVSYKGSTRKWFLDFLDDEVKAIKVIGNILEHPHLLEVS